MNETLKPTAASPYWGSFIVEIFKKLLQFNQLCYGTKKTF